MVCWKGCFSNVFHIESGIRQGGICSPVYFNAFINELIVKLRKSGLGCALCDIYCGCMFFADDILLMPGSIRQLQLMLDICIHFASNVDLKFNYAKSHLFQVGLSSEIVLPKLCLDDNDLACVKDLKYLSVTMILGKKLVVDINVNCRKFLFSICNLAKV